MARTSGWRYSLALPLFVLLGTLVAACRPEPPTAPPPPAGVVKAFGAGPLKLELKLDRERLTVAEQLHVELRAETDESNRLQVQELKEVPGFAVAPLTQSQPEMVAPGRVAVTFRYTLEPLAPGAYTLPALTVEAWDKGEAEAAITSVATTPLPVRVESLLPAGDKGETISDIAPPLAKPVNPWLWGAAGAALLLLLALILYLLKRRRERVIPPPPPLPPHLLAYQALDRLLASELLRRGELQAFYATLSDILRQYIEERFGLKAPERTTEEFLAELQTMASGSPGEGAELLAVTSHRLLLRDFLTRCDLVKFARATPALSEAEEACAVCRRFVRETEPAPPPAGGHP